MISFWMKHPNLPASLKHGSMPSSILIWHGQSPQDSVTRPDRLQDILEKKGGVPVLFPASHRGHSITETKAIWMYSWDLWGEGKGGPRTPSSTSRWKPVSFLEEVTENCCPPWYWKTPKFLILSLHIDNISGTVVSDLSLHGDNRILLGNQWNYTCRCACGWYPVLGLKKESRDVTSTPPFWSHFYVIQADTSSSFTPASSLPKTSDLLRFSTCLRRTSHPNSSQRCQWVNRTI